MHPSEFLGDYSIDVCEEAVVANPVDATAVELEWVADTASPVADGNEFPGGSALLKNQALCPFKAWADHRLCIGEPAGVVTGLSPAERGSFVHHVLRYLWMRVQGSDTLGECSASQRAQWIDEAVDAGMRALEAEAERHGLSLGARAGRVCLDLEKERVSSLAAEWLEIESQRFESFKVVDCELDASIELSGLHLKLRLDRVDELADGGFASALVRIGAIGEVAVEIFRDGDLGGEGAPAARDFDVFLFEDDFAGVVVDLGGPLGEGELLALLV